MPELDDQHLSMDDDDVFQVKHGLPNTVGKKNRRWQRPSDSTIRTHKVLYKVPEVSRLRMLDPSTELRETKLQKVSMILMSGIKTITLLTHDREINL